MKIWMLRPVWCAECRRIVLWKRGEHLSTHQLPPGVFRR